MEQPSRYTDEELESVAPILDTVTGAMRRQNEFRHEMPLALRFPQESPRPIEQQPPRADEYDPSKPWQVQGACTRENPETFFPPKNNSEAAQPAKDICRRCVVVEQCLNYAIDADEQHGVWGGKSENELRALRRRKKRYGHI